MSLLQLIYNNEKDLFQQVKEHLDAGADPNEKTEYFETPLRVSSNNGRFDVVKLLFEYGADPAHLNWTPLFHAIAYGDLTEVKHQLAGGASLTDRDTWDRTPLLLAVQSGDVAKARIVLEAGADPNEKGRCGKTAPEYTLQDDNAAMLRWLVEMGFDFEAFDEFGHNLLIEAAEQNAPACVAYLLEAGADIFQKDRSQFSRKTAIAHTSHPEIIQLLLAQGADLNEVSNDVRRALLGLSSGEGDDEKSLPISKAIYQAQKHRVFGKSNPEKCELEFWYEMVRSGMGAWNVKEQFKDNDRGDEEPVWCDDRFGKSITALGNGEYIEIGGEHEDSYDPDFCIYNEVFHHFGNGEFQIYMYPKEVFPPTDFHSATLVDGSIYIIGSLGYWEERAYGSTPVYRLNISDFNIEKLEPGGEAPGWISGHTAYYDGESGICIQGGDIFYDEEGVEKHRFNEHDYVLDIKDLRWRRTDPVPRTREPDFFPEDYKSFSHSDGEVLGYDSEGQWIIVKVLKVDRVDVSKGQTIIIAGEQVTALQNDFLYVVLCSFSQPFDSMAAMQQAAASGDWKVKRACVPLRTIEFPDNARYLDMINVTDQEKQAVKQWRNGFDQGESEFGISSGS